MALVKFQGLHENKVLDKARELTARAWQLLEKPEYKGIEWLPAGSILKLRNNYRYRPCLRPALIKLNLFSTMSSAAKTERSWGENSNRC